MVEDRKVATADVREAVKAAVAREVGSGREMPPAVVGRRSWKAVGGWRGPDEH